MARNVRFQGQVIPFPDGTPDSVIARSLASMGQQQAAEEPAAEGANPVGGLIGAASGASEVLKPLGIGVGGLGGGYLVKRAFQNMRPSAPTPAAAPPSEPAPALQRPSAPAPRQNSSLVELTEDDIRNIPEFRSAKPGETVRRTFYEKVKYVAGRKPAPKPRPSAKGKAPAPAPATPEALNTPVKAGSGPVSGGPVETGSSGPTQVYRSQHISSETLARKQRGATGRQLAAREKELGAAAERVAARRASGGPDNPWIIRQGQPVTPEAELPPSPMMARPAPRVAPAATPEGEVGSQLERSLALGRSGLKGMGGTAGGVLGLLMAALDPSYGEQMDEARRLFLEQLDPNLVRHLTSQPGPRGL